MLDIILIDKHTLSIFPSSGTLPDPGIEPRFPALQAVSLPSEPLGKPYIYMLDTGLIDKHALSI